MSNKKYTCHEKRKINDMIERLKIIGSKHDFIKIGKLIRNALPPDEITEKNNGLWFDLNKVNDMTIHKIEEYITNVFNNHNQNILNSNYINDSDSEYNSNSESNLDNSNSPSNNALILNFNTLP